MGKSGLWKGMFLLLLSSLLWGMGAWAEEKGQILYYNFEDSASVVVKDASGNQNNAVIRNYKKSGFAIRSEVIRGVRVNALSLPGGKEGSYLELPEDLLDGEEQITVSAWVKLHSQSPYQRIWDFGNGQGSYLYLLSNGNNEGFRGYASAITNQGWTKEEGVEKGSDFERDIWVFTTVTIREGELSLYENGVLIGRAETEVSLKDLGGTRYNYFGRGQFADEPMEGELAELAVYNYAMKEEEVLGLYEGLGEDQKDPGCAGADPDRLLYSYRQNLGENVGEVRPLGGLENPAGPCRGRAVGEYLSCLARRGRDDCDEKLREQAKYLVRELQILQKRAEELGWGRGFLSPFPPEAWEALEKGEAEDAPYGAAGSLLNGLLDAEEALDVPEAGDAAEQLADWIADRSAAYTQDQRERMWRTETAGETGGVGKALARMAERTGEKRYLKAARRFLCPKWVEALTGGKDSLSMLSVTEGISQAETLLEIGVTDDGAKKEKDAAARFWELVTEEYSYATGLTGVDGRFRTRDQAVKKEPADSYGNQKICEQMLELTWRLHEAFPGKAKYLDYYERILNNHLTGRERQEAAGEERIFEYRDGKIRVNFYMDADLTMEQEGLEIHMDADSFGEEAAITVEGKGETSGESVTLQFRVPSWCRERFRIYVNGKERKETAGGDGYLTLKGIGSGDRLGIRLPFSCYLSEESQEGETAVMFGPFVMVTEEADWQHTLVLTENVTDMVRRLSGTLPSVEINGRRFLPYSSSVYSERRMYYGILYTDDPQKSWYRVKIEQPESEGGTVEADCELVCENGSVTVTVRPREGYMLERLSVNGITQKMEEDYICRIQKVKEDLCIQAEFALKNPFTPSRNSLEQAAVVKAHYTAPWENLEGIKDPAFRPASSNEGMGKGWGNWQQKSGTSCWVSYTWQKPVTINTCEIYWYDDEGGTGIPAEFHLEYLDGKGEWKQAVLETEPEDALKKDQYNRILLEPVTTESLRLVMTVDKEKYAVGIYRWKVSEQNRP